MRILITEDDTRLAGLLEESLTEAGAGRSTSLLHDMLGHQVAAWSADGLVRGVAVLLALPRPPGTKGARHRVVPRGRVKRETQ